jgi:hypothetical protein
MAFPPRVSEHAIQRYAERIHPNPLGVPHHRLRRDLQNMAAAGDPRVVVERGVIVTVLAPCMRGGKR